MKSQSNFRVITIHNERHESGKGKSETYRILVAINDEEDVFEDGDVYENVT